MNMFKLYVDELGTSHPSTAATQPYYILMGCIIDDAHQDQLKIKADQIKFKYWGRTDVVFHSADMARNLNDYSIFRGKSDVKEQFRKDILAFLHSSKVFITVCVIDKLSVYTNRGWDEKKIVDYTAHSVMEAFLAKVKSQAPSNGKMIFEISNSFKDRKYLETFNYLISPDFARTDTDYSFRDVQQTLTSINFVTKQNHDTETQISDMLSYGAKCKVLRDTGVRAYASDTYEHRLITVLEAKLIATPTTVGAAKRVFFDKINSFEIVT